MTPDTLSGVKTPSLEEPTSFKRPRLEQSPPAAEASIERDDAPPAESSTREKRDAASWAKSRKGKEKRTKNVGRRRGPRHDPDPSDTPKNADELGGEPRPPRLPKRLTALLIGFCGTGCSGMQMCV